MNLGIDREGALKKALEFVYKSDIEGDYHEFGVFQGNSLIKSIKLDALCKRNFNKSNIINFYGYDSFEGFPEFTEIDNMDNYNIFNNEQFKEASYSDLKKKLRILNANNNITLVKGFFKDTLTPELKRSIKNKAAVCHVDVDINSSCRTALSFIKPFIQDGTIILFDDWFCYKGSSKHGVHEAFKSWLKKTRFKAHEYFTYSWSGKAFVMELK